jgi:2-(1,2-epoxy-1,2-dihydrophenyl)acetyl-CoA isomerase
MLMVGLAKDYIVAVGMVKKNFVAYVRYTYLSTCLVMLDDCATVRYMYRVGKMLPSGGEYPDYLQIAKSESRVLVRVERMKASTHQGAHDQPWIRGDQDPRAEIAIVTMDDPETLNSLTPGLMHQLHERLLELTYDPNVRVIILTGNGRAFCSGGHLDMIASAAKAVHGNMTNYQTAGGGTSDPWRWIRHKFGGVARLITSSNAIFIAAVNGPCAGVGLAFALACDVIIPSEHARFVPAFGKLGLVPEVGTSFILTRKLGYHGALNFFIEGKHLNGEEFYNLGLCQKPVEAKELLNAAKRWANNALKLPPHALEMTKVSLRAILDMNFEASLRMEEFAEANCFSTRALPLSADTLLKGFSKM